MTRPPLQAHLLVSSDELVVERFLGRHPDTTLFLRSNLALSGLVDGDAAYCGRWAAAFRGAEVVGVAAHFWNGHLILEAPEGLAEASRLAVAASGRPLAGIVGPYAQAQAARAALGRAEAPMRLESREPLYALDLAGLRVPALLSGGEARVRAPREDELDLLTRWRVDSMRETKAQADDAGITDRAREGLERAQREGTHWVLCEREAPVAYSAFNARLPDVVQVGGVWTPPPLRSRGYGRAVVAGTLLGARARGVRRAVLFTASENAPAQRAYEALGFRRVAEYGLLGFA